MLPPIGMRVGRTCRWPVRFPVPGLKTGLGLMHEGDPATHIVGVVQDVWLVVVTEQSDPVSVFTTVLPEQEYAVEGVHATASVAGQVAVAMGVPAGVYVMVMEPLVPAEPLEPVQEMATWPDAPAPPGPRAPPGPPDPPAPPVALTVMLGVVCLASNDASVLLFAI